MEVIFRTVKPISQTVKFLIGIIANERIYDKKDIDLGIENCLGRVFDELKDNLYSVIEYPYVDKVFRDSYYSYFSSKHKNYFRDCIRVSLFARKITEEDFRDKDKFIQLEEAYVGYIIIRPTFPNVIGRSLLSKSALQESGFVSCYYKGNVMLNGVKLKVEGFPHCSQDSETITCAETTIWGIMEYFGNRYAEYKPTLPSKIIDILNKYSDQRLLPSNGLTINQISYALKDFGFGTYIYSREKAYKNEIEDIISVYIESGIPIIARVDNEKISHAILVIGHETDKRKIRPTKKNLIQVKFGNTDYEFIDHAKIKRKYLVQDDNSVPYRLIDLNNPFEFYDDEDVDFSWGAINSIAVPLYTKIYLEAYKAKKLALNILADTGFGYKFITKSLFRFYLTSSRSFKFHVASIKGMKISQKDNIINLPMPKFVWCAEIYEPQNIEKNVADALLILDATEATDNKQDALLFAGYPSQTILKYGQEFVYSKEKLEFYTKYNNNLT